MREIVTLQLGNLSNYVATHFWNAQESYFTYTGEEVSPVDHDVHWRPGIDASGSETFLPRTVVYDLKGGFGPLRKVNALYDSNPGQEEAASSSLWPGQSVVHKQQPLEPSPYQQSLDTGTPAPSLSSSTVRYWSDISRVYYHPRSLIQLYDFELNSTIRPFESFAMGTELFSSLDKDDDIVDRDFRPFVEECDRMDGIQMIATMDDAWGGFATRYLEVLRDEYPKSCIWFWGLQNPYNNAPREKRQVRISNMAQTLAQASSSASMTVPLSLPESRLPPNVQIDTTSAWQVSAVFATAIETATLQSRISAKSSSRATSLWNMTEGLNTGGNQTMCRMTMRVGPSSHRLDSDENDGDDTSLDLYGVGRLKSSTEHPRRGRVFGQLSTSRGPRLDLGKEADDQEVADPNSRRLVGDAVSNQFDCTLPFPLLDSFPRIYSDGEGHSNVNVQTRLSVDTGIASSLIALKSQATWSIDLDERETLSNALAELADGYRNDWSSGSEEDDDDL